MAFVDRNVGVTGAGAGRVLYGFGRNNEGLRIRVLEAQPTGAQGPVQGGFVVLDVGYNRHMQALARLLHRTTDAAEVLGVVRRPNTATVSVVNRNILALEGPAPASS